MRDKLHTYLGEHPEGAGPQELLDLIFAPGSRDAEFATRFVHTLLAEDPRFTWSESDGRWRSTRQNQSAQQIDATDFVVVDLETAGTVVHPGSIIEIAALRIHGGKSIDRFHTLVQSTIPVAPFVARLTGIDAAMLADAPPIADAWREFRAFIGVDIVLAHNAAFEASFLDATALGLEGTNFSNPIICTFKLARQLVPESSKRGLDALAGIFGIPLVHRHRAYGDVAITAEIFFHLRERLRERGVDQLAELVALQNQASDGLPFECPLPRSKVDCLPAEPGIYRFFDETGRLLYVGKAKSLRQRVSSYMSNSGDHSGKTLELIRRVHDLRIEATGSELEAALAEASAIRRERPPYNRLGKHLPRIAFLKLTSNDPFPRLMITRRLGSGRAPCLGPLRSRPEAVRLLALMARVFRLRTCIGRLHPDPAFTPCLQADIEACTAPCAARVDEAAYAQQVEEFLTAIGPGPSNLRRELSRRHQQAEAENDFERAASVASDIEFVERILRRQRKLGWIGAGQSFLMLHPLHDGGVIAAYAVVFGRLVVQRRIVDESEMDAFAEALLPCFLTPRAALPEDVDGAVILTAWLRDRGERDGAVLALVTPGETGWETAQVEQWRSTVGALLVR